MARGGDDTTDGACRVKQQPVANCFKKLLQSIIHGGVDSRGEISEESCLKRK